MKNNSFHEKAREALKKHLENILSSCVIDKGIVNFDRSKDEDLYKYINEAKKHKKTWMRDIDLYGLLYKQVSDYLVEHIEKIREISGKIKDIIGEKRITDLCVKIISYLESIPRKYLVFFELPAVHGLGLKEIKLTDDISFVERVGESDFSDIKIPTWSLLGGDYTLTLEKGRLYIRIAVDGYTDGTVESSAIKKAYSKFKQVILLSNLSEILKEGQRDLSLGLLGSVSHQIFVVNSRDPNIEKYLVYFPQTVSNYISKLRLNEDILKPPKFETLLETFENKEIPTSNDKAKILKKRLRYPEKLLKTSDNDENTEPIKSAIEWAFDSHANDNDTLAFIQACIGIEAVIGDDTKDNITATLADRCAYLLGDSISARKKIRENFEKLYDIRSKVVHGRKACLDDEQRHFLDYAQIMLKRVIWKEISFIGTET